MSDDGIFEAERYSPARPVEHQLARRTLGGTTRTTQRLHQYGTGAWLYEMPTGSASPQLSPTARRLPAISGLALQVY